MLLPGLIIRRMPLTPHTHAPAGAETPAGRGRVLDGSAEGKYFKENFSTVADFQLSDTNFEIFFVDVVKVLESWHLIDLRIMKFWKVYVLFVISSSLKANW